MKVFSKIILLAGFLLIITSCQVENVHNSNNTFKHLKTDYGGCNNKKILDIDTVITQNDTVFSSFKNDTLLMTVGLNYICCASFSTICNFQKDSIIITITDNCPYPYDDCYCRCNCYYIFDFYFGNYDFKEHPYRVLLYDPRVGEIKIFKEGLIKN